MSIVFLVGRIILGGYFLFNAFNHLTNVDQMEGYAASKDVPMPRMAVIGTGILLALGGAGIVLGFAPQLAILLLLLFLLPTTFMMHEFWSLEGEERMNERVNFMKNLALVGALLMLLTLSSGWPLSL